MRKVVGIDRKIKRAWVDAVLDRLAQTTDEAELRIFLDKHLKDELPGKESRAKTTGIILRIWSGIPSSRVALRDRAVAMLPRISGQERIWLHWGMTALAYPFFRDTAEVVGRLLALQDDFTTAQVQGRMLTAWGDRATSKEAAQKLITTLVDWEVLRSTKTQGHFLLARKMTTSIPDLQLWLLEALLDANAADEIEAHQLLRLPESFPFSLSIGVADLRRHEGFNIHRQGLDMDMVALRKVKIEPPPKRERKPKNKKAPKPGHGSLFDMEADSVVSKQGTPDTTQVDSMHVLRYLSDPKCEQKPEESVFAEYRLLCSGTLHRDILGDWSKSEVARILLDEPLLLFAASRPFDDHPLELVLHLSVPQVQETGDNYTSSYYPDDEVARDLAALLTLLCRRLITVAGKANERHTTKYGRHPLFDGVPVPLPLANSMQRIFWTRHPAVITTGRDTQRIEDYNPWPKPVDGKKLTALLLGLPRSAHAASIVASARLYALALEMIHERPDISYQLLISSVETIADAALHSFEPPPDAQVKHQKAVFDLAISLGMKLEQATQLAIEACKHEYWVKRKFKKFLIDNVDDSIWTEQDDLFRIARVLTLPQREDFEKTLSKVYDARSKATHVGKPFPVTALHTGGPFMPEKLASAVFRSIHSGSPLTFPPVAWFERVVNSAISSFWERSLTNAQTEGVNRGNEGSACA